MGITACSLLLQHRQMYINTKHLNNNYATMNLNPNKSPLNKFKTRLLFSTTQIYWTKYDAFSFINKYIL